MPLPTGSMVELLGGVVKIAQSASEVVLEVYGTDFSVRGKDDASPVTEADARAEALILERLNELTPGVPVVAEEAVAAGRVPVVGDCFWLVDPLDGTNEFINRNGGRRWAWLQRRPCAVCSAAWSAMVPS
jgi:3'(2'), 5'-bisphosphate nucleotidase